MIVYLLAITVCPGAVNSCQSENGPPVSERHGLKVQGNTLSNATFSGIFDHPVTLKDGLWEGEPFVEGGASRPSVGLVEDFCLKGDLNADGFEENVVLLWENSGGSGTRSYLAVMSQPGNGFINLATALIGDRVQLRSGHIAEGKIELSVVQQGPKDAACCPSQVATRFWSLEANGLSESQPQIVGALSLSVLAGTEWVLAQFSRSDRAPAEPKVTLILEGDRFTGQSGCNRYFVEPQAGPNPGELSVGPIGATRMACPEDQMDLENRYLSALGNVTKFGFLNGMLALTWQQDGTTSTMLFRSRTM